VLNAANGTMPQDYASYVVEIPHEEFRVRSSIYCDPDVFADELQRIFERSWIYVGHESELPVAGDFKLAAIGRVPVIVSRDVDNKIHVLINMCRHRGTAVCNEPRGNNRYFVCPYHRWTYDSAGKLVSLADEEGYPLSARDRIGGLIRIPHVATFNGLIFARIGEGESLEDFLQPIRRHLDLWFSQSPIGRIKVLPPTVSSYPANWKFQVENTTDGWHARYVHNSAFKILEEHGMRDRKRGVVGVSRGYDNGHALLHRPLRRFFEAGAMERYRQTLIDAHGPDRGREAAEYGGQMTIFPNFQLVEHRFRLIQPVSVSETIVYEIPVTFEGVPEEINAEIRSRFTEEGGGMISGFVNSDDIEMFARVQMALNASHLAPWLDMSRGIAAERADPGDGIVSEAAHELPLRAMYRHWRTMMASNP
jgi:benzoate/toluate 1,2-dioxygenase alpha subunit